METKCACRRYFSKWFSFHATATFYILRGTFGWHEEKAWSRGNKMHEGVKGGSWKRHVDYWLWRKGKNKYDFKFRKKWNWADNSETVKYQHWWFGAREDKIIRRNCSDGGQTQDWWCNSRMFKLSLQHFRVCRFNLINVHWFNPAAHCTASNTTSRMPPVIKLVNNVITYFCDLSIFGTSFHVK